MVPSILSFTSHVTSERPTPLIIESSIAYWPALSTRPWANLDYLLEAAGEERIVPVEIGAKYTDQKWSQKLMSFGDFLRKCTESSYIDEEMKSSDIFYLAQHDLFEQIPRLKEDISIPDYCFVDTLTSVAINSTSNVYYQPPSDVIINAWLGPKGTISPMHTDPYHNLLAQVVGKKYIRLYGPEETPNVYPFAQDNFLKNTSQVDIESPDYSQFPKFPSAHYVECVLSPGELLYIPPGWWHYVRSLSVSFSVSFWF
ncbi:hypothetical protein G9A89_003925 [Geosiphon pyriformis]|nr:hypothetical protein G9A89_003925 [Geosiphon pyriformis]